MKILVLIPARMNSSRFPGKPMEKILNKPMIGHVYDNVKRSKIVDKVAVATCDSEIFEYIESLGGIAVMTSENHKRASDRCSEALIKIENKYKIKYDIVVMVQGDEPMVSYQMIEEAVKPMILDSSILVTNLLGKIENNDEFCDRNCIKVVCDLESNALYFSREPIPTNVNTKNILMGKQVCIIPFKRDFLIQYTKLLPTPLEIIESIDMLRVIEHGFKVRMVKTNYKTYPVDTKKDLKKVESLIKNVKGS